MHSAPFRSDKVLKAAKGKRCTLRIAPDCDGGGETTVACHIRDRHKGMARKASDHSIAFGCRACHDFLDVGFARAGWTADDLAPFEKQGLQETWEMLIEAEVIGFPHNPERSLHDIPTKPRLPKEERAPVAQRQNPWPPKGARKINSANNLSRKATT